MLALRVSRAEPVRSRFRRVLTRAPRRRRGFVDGDDVRPRGQHSPASTRF